MSRDALEDLQAAALTIENLEELNDPSAQAAIPAVRRVFDGAAKVFAQELTTLFGIYVKPPRARMLAFTMDFGREGGRQAIAAAFQLAINAKLPASPARILPDGELQTTAFDSVYPPEDTKVALFPSIWPLEWRPCVTEANTKCSRLFDTGQRSALDAIKEYLAEAAEANIRETAAPVTLSVSGATGPQAFC